MGISLLGGGDLLGVGELGRGKRERKGRKGIETLVVLILRMQCVADSIGTGWGSGRIWSSGECMAWYVWDLCRLLLYP